MATVTSLASGTSTVNDTTVTTGATVSVSVNDWLVVIIATPNSGAGGAAPTYTVEDSDGLNTYTERRTINRDPGAAGDGTTLGIFTCQVTDAVTSGTITVTLSDAAGSKTVQVYRVRPATNEVLSHVATSTGSTGNASTFSAPAVSVTNGNIIFGCASLEDNGAASGDSDTTNGSWSAVVNRIADNGSDSNSTTCVSQYKTVTATGSQTWNGSTSDGTAKQYAASYIVIGVDKVLTAGAGSYTISGTSTGTYRGRLTTAAAGSYTITGTDASLSASGSKVVNMEAGSYSITGTDASTLQAYRPSAAAGSYAITGTDTPTLHGWYVDATTGGSYTITGTDAGTYYGYKVPVTDVGAYLFTGTDVALQESKAKSIAALSGSYAITGTDATTTHGQRLAAAAGSYAQTGTDATFVRSFKAFPDAGSYDFTGTDATLTKTNNAPIPIRGYLKTAPYSHSLAVVVRPPSDLEVESHIHTIEIKSATWQLKVAG